MSGPRWRWGEGIAFLLLVTIWAACRVFPALPHVLPGTGETVLLGNDPWFHLHQLAGAVEHFPRILRWDVGALYPEGSRVAASGLFHLGLASVAKGLGLAAEDTDALALLLALSPLVLGAASLGFLFLLAREIGGRLFASLTLIVRILFPGGELERTLFGFGDQHAAEILLVTAGLWSWVRWTRTGGSTDRFKIWGGGVLAALPVAVLFFTWFGAPLFLAVVIASFWMIVLLDLCQGRREAIPLSSIAFFSGIFALVGVTGVTWSEGIMVPGAWWFSLGALAVQLVLMIGVKRALGSTMEKPKSVAVINGLSLLLLFAAGLFLYLNPLVASLAAHFLTPANRGISEHALNPFQICWWDYGFLLPWLVFGLGWGISRGASAAHRFVFAAIGCWGALALVRSDFFYLTGALFPLVIVFGAMRFGDWVRSRGRGDVASLPVCAAVLSVLLAVPLGRLRAPCITRAEVSDLVVATSPWREAMAWLKESAPVTSSISPRHPAPAWRKRDGFSYPPGTHAVFTHWQYGNLVPALGGRVAVSARSRSPLFIEWFLEQEEMASHSFLDRIGEVRYLVMDATSVCDLFPTEALQAGIPREGIQVADGEEWEGVPLLSFGNPFRRSLGANLYLGDAIGMERYRLVHESDALSLVRYRMRPEEAIATLRSDLVEPANLEALRKLVRAGTVWKEDEYWCYSGQILPAVKIFERVTGAVIEGKADPGSTVRVELTVAVAGSDREIVYRREAVASAEGKVRFRVPYSSEGRPEGYRITRAGGAEALVSVREEEIQTGAVIPF